MQARTYKLQQNKAYNCFPPAHWYLVRMGQDHTWTVKDGHMMELGPVHPRTNKDTWDDRDSIKHNADFLLEVDEYPAEPQGPYHSHVGLVRSIRYLKEDQSSFLSYVVVNEVYYDYLTRKWDIVRVTVSTDYAQVRLYSPVGLVAIIATIDIEIFKKGAEKLRADTQATTTSQES